MQISDLVSIGKLGNTIDKEGFLPFKPNEFFQPELLSDVFLVFKDYRVRYVSVIHILKNKVFKIKIDDLDSAKEAIKDGNVKVMLPQKQIGVKISEDHEQFVDKIVVKRNEVIGKVIDIFNNSEYNVLIVSLKNKHEVMIPVVEQFIDKIEDSAIYVKQIDELITL